MRTRSVLVGCVLVVAVAGLTPSAHADTVSGRTDFSVSAPVHCRIVPDTGGFDTTVTEAGTNPSSVTVGERIQVDFTELGVPNAAGPNSRVVRLHVSGPVTPNGDVTIYPDYYGPFLTLKAIAAGTVSIDLVFTQGSLVFRGVTYFTQCTPTAGTVPLTTFLATTKPVCLGLPATIVGTSGNDRITGTNHADAIVARGGDDTIDARDGNDVVCGDHGNDTIDAGRGADRVDGGYANDDIRGGSNVDWLDGGSGQDRLDGGPGVDTCRNGETVVTGCEL
jgi:Ca2+-binding RTX toxin-like protein